MVYGHEAVLPWETRHGSRRVTFQDQLTADDYMALMKDELEDLTGHRLHTLINVEANKARVGRWYDKKVKGKTFDQGDLVWKLILPIGTKDPRFGKWSPTWEGHLKLTDVFLETHIFWRHWKERNFPEHLMENI